MFGYVADMVAFCDDPDVIGSDFYVMARLDGTILRRDLPAGLTLTADAARTLCTNFLDVLVELHSVDPSAAGLDDLGKGSGYVARQVGGWSQRFRTARTDNVGDYERVMGWLDEHQPEDVATCVIHNDFRLDNVVLDPDDPMRVVGVLDWEMATLGDPLMDLGGALAYWIQADDEEELLAFRRQPTHVPGMLTRDRDGRPLHGEEGSLGHAGAVAVLRGVRAVPARRDRPADLLPLPPRADHQRGVRPVPAGHDLPREALQRADRRGVRMTRAARTRSPLRGDAA